MSGAKYGAFSRHTPVYHVMRDDQHTVCGKQIALPSGQRAVWSEVVLTDEPPAGKRLCEECAAQEGGDR